MKKTLVRIILMTLFLAAGATPVLADGGGEPAPLCYPRLCAVK